MAKKADVAFNLSAARVVRGMQIAEHQSSSRYNLTGIFVEPIKGGGAWLVATDGRIMLVQRDKEAVATEAAILRFTPPQFTPVADEDGYVTTNWHWCGSRIEVPPLHKSETIAAPVTRGGTWLHVLAERIDATYPDWRTVFGKMSSTSLVNRRDNLLGINPYLLQQMIGPEASLGGIQIHGDYSDSRPLLVTFGSDPDSFAAIMKMTLDAKACPLNGLLTAIGREDLTTDKTVH